MSSTALKILALVTLLLAIGLGYVAYRMSQSMTAPSPEEAVVETSEKKQLAYTMAAVTVKPVRAHEVIEDKHVEMVPVSVLPPQYFESKDEVVGKSPLVDVDTGTTLTPRLFKQSNVLSKSIPEGHRAMSLEIDDVIAVGGFVQPGDIVDTLLYIRAQSKEVNDSQARLLLEKAMVLAYEERILPEMEDEPAEGAENQQQRQNRRRQRTVVLAVPEKDTVKVVLGASIGDIRLALHGQPAEDAEAMADGDGELTMAKAEAKTDKQADEEDEEPSIKPITLRELSEIKKQRSTSKRRYVPPPIYVYRGNKVESVRQ